MTKPMPEAPEANRSKKGTGERHAGPAVETLPAKHPGDVHITEQGDTANVMQNTTNKGPFRGRRMK
jgi:hypothetical protein